MNILFCIRMNPSIWFQILVVSLVVGLFYNYLKTSQQVLDSFTLRYLPEQMTMTEIPTKYHNSVWKIGNQSR
jgi:flagellar biosynthesis protein FliQ